MRKRSIALILSLCVLLAGCASKDNVNEHADIVAENYSDIEEAEEVSVKFLLNRAEEALNSKDVAVETKINMHGYAIEEGTEVQMYCNMSSTTERYNLLSHNTSETAIDMTGFSYKLSDEVYVNNSYESGDGKSCIVYQKNNDGTWQSYALESPKDTIESVDFSSLEPDLELEMVGEGEQPTGYRLNAVLTSNKLSELYDSLTNFENVAYSDVALDLTLCFVFDENKDFDCLTVELNKPYKDSTSSLDDFSLIIDVLPENNLAYGIPQNIIENSEFMTVDSISDDWKSMLGLSDEIDKEPTLAEKLFGVTDAHSLTEEDILKYSNNMLKSDVDMECLRVVTAMLSYMSESDVLQWYAGDAWEYNDDIYKDAVAMLAYLNWIDYDKVIEAGVPQDELDKLIRKYEG